MEFFTKYSSSGCNRTPHAADWGNNHRICYATGCSVGLFSTHGGGKSCEVTSTLRCHTGPVTSVRWLRNQEHIIVDMFISTSADKTAVVGYVDSENTLHKITVLHGHESTVSIADGLVTQCGSQLTVDTCDLLFVTASIDATLKIWSRSSLKDSHCMDTIKLNSGFALDVRLTNLPFASSTTLLACATDDRKIHLFMHTGQKQTFEKVHVITGHEDWVRSLDFIRYRDKLLLASASQDSLVKIHEFSLKSAKKAIGSFLIESEETELTYDIYRIGLRLETVLTGHENWVYGASFHVSMLSGEIRLLTSSMDKTLVIWAPENDLWTEVARLGEVGGNTLGFYGGKFSPDGKCVMAHGYQGSFHIWRSTQDNSWEPEVVVGGHLGEVTDISWAPSGRYLLSVGCDQTTRLHALWQHNNKSEYHEIARPQVHGHDMSCIATISDTCFISGAEEKVLRAFRAPSNFVQNFKRICQIDVSDNIQIELPEGAAVPALGLSNKPVFHDPSNGASDPDLYFSPLTLDYPPTEENLMQNTLWPEEQKLYGHGYEIHCVAATTDGTIVASACHATNIEHASAIIWDTKTWNEVQKLSYHRLTITQMAFSPNGDHLVTASRDRRWCLYKRNSETGLYETHATGEKTPHTRIIWCCAWSKDGKLFGTGSRDGVICIWESQNGTCVAHESSIGDSVTALAFSKTPSYQVIILAGTESGMLIAYEYNLSCLTKIHEQQSNSGTVHRIEFQPGSDHIFAICSKESLRIYQTTP